MFVIINYTHDLRAENLSDTLHLMCNQSTKQLSSI